MHQFEIKKLIPIDLGFVDISFTNSALYCFIIVGVVFLLFWLGVRGRGLVPSRMQSLAESFYEFTRNMVRDTAGEGGLKYFPYIFTLFIFVFFANMVGMIPGSFTVTSHFAVTATLALAVFFTVTAIGFIKHGLHFFKFFAPEGAPMAMMPLLVVIEVISYFVRPFSHSVRLAANMTAGHAMLKVFAGFAGAMGVFAIFPIIGMVGVTALEVLVSAIQAYVFAILTCIYLNDALHMH